HQLGVFLDRKNPDDLTDPRRGLHVDHALYAAGREPVIFERRALAIAVFGDRKDQAFLADDFDTDQIVALFEIHGANPSSRTAHWADVLFLEPARHAFVRTEEDIVFSASEPCCEQFVTIIEPQRNDSPRHRIVELRQLGLLNHALLSDHDDELTRNEF